MPLKYDDNERIVYACTKCGVQGCKLWREYNTFLEHQELYCVGCAGLDQNEDTSGMDADGKKPTTISGIDMGRCDQIGWLIPAVPTEEGDTFWGYTSVPQPLVEWWRKLPTFPV